MTVQKTTRSSAAVVGSTNRPISEGAGPIRGWGGLKGESTVPFGQGWTAPCASSFAFTAGCVPYHT